MFNNKKSYLFYFERWMALESTHQNFNYFNHKSLIMKNLLYNIGLVK